MNAPPLLAELNAHIAAYQTGDEPHVINLSLLPQTEQDLAFLEQRLGVGHANQVKIISTRPDAATRLLRVKLPNRP